MKKRRGRMRAYWRDIVRARKHIDASSFRQYAVDRIEDAVGTLDGKAHFAENAVSNMGRISETGREVQMVCMASLLRKLPQDQMVDLLKIDIEGGEQTLLTEGAASWLSRVREII